MTTNDTSMKKTLTIWNFFTIGFGAIIDTGWVLQVGDWMDKGGGPVAAIIAFILGAIFLLPVGAVFGELTSAIPISGGIVEYVDRTFGKKLSFVTGWFLSLGNGILCPWEAIAISKLVGMLIPQLKIIPLYTIMGYTVYLPPLLISLAFAFYVIRLNFKGASSAAKLQGFLTKMLLAGMLIAMVVSVFTGGPHHLQPIVSESNGNSLIMGIIPVLVMTPFFYAGFDTIPQQAEEAAEGLDSCKAGVHLIIHGQTLNDECLDIMAEKGIYFCPTIQFLNEWFKTYQPPYVPEVHDKFPGETVAEKELNRVYSNLRRAKEKGIVLTIGSDSFCSSLTPYGTTAIGEMYSFNEKAGIDPMDVIVAATKNGADMLKVGDITGTLEEGKFADLLVIKGNPLENIRAVAVENMEVIMKEGAFVKGA